MALENRKQLLIIVGAVAAGIVATAMTSNYIKTSLENQAIQLKEETQASQKQLVAQLQQRSDQQMAELAQEIQRSKAEQAEQLRSQLAAMQAQMEAAQAKQAAAAAAVVEVKKRKPSLALKTPVGKRAVTVMIDSLAAVGGLLNAGDNVDIIAHLIVPLPDGDKKNTMTAMIFQNLQVLAVNTNLDDPGAYDDQQAVATLKVTFAVDPQEAGLLSFDDRNGKLELALRSPNETDKLMVKASTWKTLADYVLENQGTDIRTPDGEKAPAEKPAEQKPNIQIFRGGKEL